MEPDKILSIDLWMRVFVNLTDLATMENLSQIHQGLANVLKCPPESVYTMSGIAKPPAAVIEYDQKLEKHLNYMEVLHYNSFKPFVHNLADSMNVETNEGRASHYEEMILDLDNDKVKVIVADSGSSRTLAIPIDLRSRHLPCWLAYTYTVHYSGCVSENTTEEQIGEKFLNDSRVTEHFTWIAEHNAVNIGRDSMNLKTFERLVYFRRCVDYFKFYINLEYLGRFRPIMERRFISIKALQITCNIDCDELTDRINRINTAPTN